MKSSLWLLSIVSLALLAGAALALGEGNQQLRWDLIELDRTNLTVNPNGEATAQAADGSAIIMTGTGTFRLKGSNATGGGMWETRDSSDHVIATGTYEVTRLVTAALASGTLPSPPFTDNVGDAAHARSGLIVMNIDYSDASAGTLLVSCELPAGTPADVFEGIAATKDAVGYWKHTSGDTVFHVIQGSR